MNIRNNTAQVAVKAAALPSATKTEARTARPATEQKWNTMQTTDKRENSWTPKSAIFGDDAARVLGLQVTAFVRTPEWTGAEEGGGHGL